MSEYQQLSKKDLKGMHPELRKVVEIAIAAGALGKRTSKNHLMLKFPNGQTVLLAGTPSDYRSAKNSMAQVKRVMRGEDN